MQRKRPNLLQRKVPLLVFCIVSSSKQNNNCFRRWNNAHLLADFRFLFPRLCVGTAILSYTEFSLRGKSILSTGTLCVE